MSDDQALVEVDVSSKTRLGRWIEDNDMTFAEVADLTGYSKSMIGLAARGERNLSAAGKVRIARRLGERVSTLFDVDDVAGKVSA